MTTFTVASRTALNQALASAKGGDSIVLKDGNYGAVRITADYASTVTIRAEDPLDATVGHLDVWGASNLRFEGIKFASGGNGGLGSGIVSIQGGSQNVQVVNSEVTGSVGGGYKGHYGVYVRNSNGVTIANNKVHDVDSGIVAFGAANLTVAGNGVDYVGRDVMKFSGLNNASISGNKSNGHIYPFEAVHNDFIQFQGSSSNVRIEDNVFLASTIGHVQGIFINAGFYRNFKIDGNIVYTGMIQGVAIEEGSGITISNNTLLNAGITHNATKILAPAGSVITNNITTSNTSSTYGSNLEIQNTKPGAAYYIDSLFKNGSEGIGVTIQDLTPVAGSAAMTKGAAATLKALLGGTAPEPAAPSPAPTPSPSPDGSGGVAINAGGKASGGFKADTGFSGGSTYSTKASIAGTGADAIYQTERWGDFRYGVAVEDGRYDVTLKFAEIYHGAAGKRVFDVRAEGKLVLDNYDVFREAGGKNRAVDETFTVQVTDGRLDLGFDGVVDNAKVGGIVIALDSLL
jgi:parallel beta-helix repeat protein